MFPAQVSASLKLVLSTIAIYQPGQWV